MIDLGNEGPKGADTRISSGGESKEVKNPLRVVEKIFGFLADLFFGGGEKRQSAQKVMELPQVKHVAEAIDKKLEDKPSAEKEKHSGAFEAIKVMRGKREVLESGEKELSGKSA